MFRVEKPVDHHAVARHVAPYTYDDAGRRTSVTTPEGTESYTYDTLGRLTQVAYPGGPTVSYTYDAAGNRKTETRGSTTTNYDYDAVGQLVTVGNKSYTYDANGNLTQAGSDSFTWDHDNRLTQATVGSHTGSYTYDGDGVRVGASLDGNQASYLVDTQDGLPVLVDDGSKAYLHADGVLSEVGTSGATQLLGDALGSVRGLADTNGTLIGSRSYEAFGVPRTTIGASSLLGFTGEPTDTTGLVDLRARFLDSGTGRFLSADSLQPNAPGTQGYNSYVYAANNPATWTDPTGHLVPAAGALEEVAVEALEDFLRAVPAAAALERELLLRSIASTAGAIQAELAAQATLGARTNNPYLVVAAVLTGMFIVAVLLVVLVEVVLHGVAITTQGSLNRDGKTEWPMSDLRTATETHPPSPVPPLATVTSCPAPPGTIGPAGLLRYTNTGHGAECETHHIIQEAAVREVPNYQGLVAPAIVLTVAAHKVATRSQREAKVGGTYGAERQVAFLALRDAGVPTPIRFAALAAADLYFMGALGLNYNSPTRIPGTRWGYVG
jgi:RHS repeat-associated protein